MINFRVVENEQFFILWSPDPLGTGLSPTAVTRSGSLIDSIKIEIERLEKLVKGLRDNDYHDAATLKELEIAGLKRVIEAL